MESPVQNRAEQNINRDKFSIPMAIIVAGILIGGAIYFSSVKPANIPVNGNGAAAITLAPVGAKDRTLGNPNAKVTLVMYEDFQCPYCGAVSGLLPTDAPVMQSLRQGDPAWTPFMPEILNNYVKNGDVLFVYRDYTFLGPESVESAEAARCAGDQGKFWEYHDYLFAHQSGENQGNFSNTNLESFAKGLGLNTAAFNQCLISNKYAQAVADSKTEGDNAGVTGTPKGFILKNGKIVSTIDGAEPLSSVKPKIDAALQ